MSTIKKQNKFKSKKEQLKGYTWFSGIAFQMLAIILVGVFGGIKLDKLLALKFPVFTIVLTLISVALSMYVIIKETLKK